VTRPVWTGTISFGLVAVPVKAYTAVRDHTVHFNQIDRESGARVGHRNVSTATGEEVERDDILLGYEVSKGRYVTFERDELEELRPASTKAIEVRDFVDLDDVDPIYYQRTYWLGPDGDAARAPYELLLAAMTERGRVAIGTVVMRNKAYLAAVRPLDGALALSTMRFADEVIDRAGIPEVPAEVGEPDPKALGLAVQIVDSLSGGWEPEQYEDAYVAQLHEIIDAKAKGQTLAAEAGPDRNAKVLDLMEALRASLDATSPGTGAAADGDVGDEAEDGAAASARRHPSGGSARKQASPRRAPAKKAAARKATKKAPAKKATAKKAPSKKAAARKSA
jgi:DNA end-binding protein Ku